MQTISKRQREQLIKNWSDEEGKLSPVIKIFSRFSNAIWLIHSINPNDNDTLFGLYDLGFGFPKLDYFSLSELYEVWEGPENNFYLKTDNLFRPNYSLNDYAKAAKKFERIVEESDQIEGVL